MKTLNNYFENIRRFSPQARLYLLVATLQGIGWGVFRLFFNFYVLSLGYEKGFLGLLISLPSLTALLFALFAGYISDLIGRKRSFILGGGLIAASQALMMLFPSTAVFIISSVIQGIGSSLFNVSSAPFLMEHSSESERTHLFSFHSGLTTMSSFVGNFVGGGLPLFFGNIVGASTESSVAYAWSLGAATLLSAMALIPLRFLKVKRQDLSKNPSLPLHSLWENRNSLTKLLLPNLVTSLGAGMLIPFLNIFFRERYALSDELIGSLFGFSSLGMGVAILAAPIFAEKWGKSRAIIITRGISIPFLITLGFVPHLGLAVLSFFMRAALMNFSAPIYQTMVMEEIEEGSRGIVASLNSMLWNIGWSISPAISGPIQDAYGFNPVFVITIISYVASIYLLYVWFVKPAKHNAPLAIQTQLAE